MSRGLLLFEAKQEGVLSNHTEDAFVDGQFQGLVKA